MNEDTKYEFLAHFSLSEPYVSPKAQANGSLEAEVTSYMMLNYVLDNLASTNEDIAAHLKAYPKNPLHRINLMVCNVQIGATSRSLDKDEYEIYKAMLKDYDSIFCDGTWPAYKVGKRLGLSKDEYVDEAINFVRCFAETYLCLHHPEEAMVDNRTKILVSDKTPKYTCADLELLEALREQGMLQCDLEL